MQEIGIESSLVEEIKKGNKSIEGRLGKPRYLKLKEGDLLGVREDLWHDGKIIDSFSDSLIIKITQILYFESFKEMVNAIDFQAAVPSAKTSKEAIKKYKEYYSDKDEEEYGVVAILFELVA